MWNITYKPQAQDDLDHLDGSVRKQVLVVISVRSDSEVYDIAKKRIP